MGDVGEYWKDAKEHRRRVQGAQSLGMTMGQYIRWERQTEKEDQQRRGKEKLDKCTIQCECGKWLLDTAAHNSHKMVKGRKGHAVKERKEAKMQEMSFDITF
jgi:hypothetical protein